MIINHILEHSTKIRVRTLILFTYPLRNPATQHWINQHLQHPQSPTSSNSLLGSTLELSVQVLNTQKPLSVRTSRNLPRFLEFRPTIQSHTDARLDLTNLLYVCNHLTPFFSRHHSPMRYHASLRIALVSIVLDVRAICTITWCHHQSRRIAHLNKLTPIVRVLPPELEQRYVSHRFSRIIKLRCIMRELTTENL